MSIKVAAPNVCFFSLSTILTFTKSCFPSQCCQLHKLDGLKIGSVVANLRNISCLFSKMCSPFFGAKICQKISTFKILKMFQVGNTGCFPPLLLYCLLHTPNFSHSRATTICVTSADENHIQNTKVVVVPFFV